MNIQAEIEALKARIEALQADLIRHAYAGYLPRIPDGICKAELIAEYHEKQEA